MNTSVAIADTAERGGAIASAGRIARGVIRLLTLLDFRALTEFRLPDGRRADVAAVDARGGFALVEVKSSLADFRADGKWPCYLDYCDAFYFAVAPSFPREVLPDNVGLIVSDGWEAAVVRPAAPVAMAAARRRALLLRFARTAAGRLAGLVDPSWQPPG